MLALVNGAPVAAALAADGALAAARRVLAAAEAVLALAAEAYRVPLGHFEPEPSPPSGATRTSSPPPRR